MAIKGRLLAGFDCPRLAAFEVPTDTLINSDFWSTHYPKTYSMYLVNDVVEDEETCSLSPDSNISNSWGWISLAVAQCPASHKQAGMHFVVNRATQEENFIDSSWDDAIWYDWCVTRNDGPDSLEIRPKSYQARLQELPCESSKTVLSAYTPQEVRGGKRGQRFKIQKTMFAFLNFESADPSYSCLILVRSLL